MPAGLILPLVLLAVAFLGGIILLRLDRRERRIHQQVEFAAEAPETEAGGPPSQPRIRRRRVGSVTRAGVGYYVFGYDPETPRTWPLSRTIFVAVLIGIAVAMLGRIAMSLWAGLLAGFVVGVLAVRALLKWQRDNYADRLVRQLPDTVQIIVSAVRAGMPIGEAIRIIAKEMPNPTSEQFTRVVDELALGTRPEEGLLGIYERTQVPEYAIFAVTVSVQSKAGGRLAETMQIMGDTIRERIALAGRAKALSAEAKLSAQVLTALPFIAGGLLSLERPGYMNVFFETQRGRGLFATGIVLLVIGVLTMRNMIRNGTRV